jgi:hypothetical protein
MMIASLRTRIAGVVTVWSVDHCRLMQENA